MDWSVERPIMHWSMSDSSPKFKHKIFKCKVTPSSANSADFRNLKNAVTFPDQREMESDSGPDSLKNCAAFAAAKPVHMRENLRNNMHKADAKGEMHANCAQTALPPLAAPVPFACM